jgi:hypothetical protein
VHRWKQPGADPTGSVLVAECGDYRDKEIARFNMERWCADAALIAALCSEPARNHIAKALDLLERMQAGEAELVAKVAMLLDHPSVFMGGPSVQSKRKAGYLLHELAALVGEG